MKDFSKHLNNEKLVYVYDLNHNLQYIFDYSQCVKFLIDVFSMTELMAKILIQKINKKKKKSFHGLIFHIGI